MENKQTVLEKVINDLEQMKEDGIKFMTIDDFISELYQAKEMFQKQIEEAFNAGYRNAEKDLGQWIIAVDISTLSNAPDYFTKKYQNGENS